jgi:sugar phosphate isomerase/epimerase
LALFYAPQRLSAGEQALFYRFLEELAEHAEKVSAIAMLEPINRYETPIYHTIDEVRAVLERVGSRRLRMVIDFFHMNIEEADIPASIEAAADHIFHVQLGDNNRKLPGKGSLDFRPGFAALRHTGYDRYMALECQIPEDPERELPACVDYLRRCLRSENERL